MPDWFVVWYKNNQRGEERQGSEQSAERRADELRSAGYEAQVCSEPNVVDFQLDTAPEVDIYPTTAQLSAEPPKATLIDAHGNNHCTIIGAEVAIVLFGSAEDASKYENNCTHSYEIGLISVDEWPKHLQTLRKAGVKWVYVPTEIEDDYHRGETYRVEEGA